MKRKALFVFLVAGAFGVFYFLLSQKARVVSVSCRSQFGLCSSEIEELIAEYEGETYFSAKGSLAQRLSESSRIEHYTIRYSLPSSMKVEVVEKKPEYAAKFADERYFLFDREANVVSEATETSLPTVVVRELPPDEDIRYGILLFGLLYTYYGVYEAELTVHGLHANVSGVETAFPLSGDVDTILGSLEVVLLQLNKARQNPTITIGSGENVSVDLRYKNPVIKGI